MSTAVRNINILHTSGQNLKSDNGNKLTSRGDENTSLHILYHLFILLINNQVFLDINYCSLLFMNEQQWERKQIPHPNHEIFIPRSEI